jgi:hypothetical protein
MQMKTKLLLLLFLPKIIFAQTENLIRNEGFEYKTNDASSYEPNALSQFKFISYWKEEIYDAGSSGQNHSPDFFSSSTSFRAFDAISGTIVNPHGGSNYVGMGQAELIQQEFSEVAELIKGKKYTISFYIQPLKNSQAGGNWSSYTLLSIMLRKKKMQYENHTNENYYEWCTDLANDHRNEDGPTYHVADIPINLSSYPLGVWTKISVDFDAPNNAEDYDYVIFETNDNLDMCDSYICLDDFRFYQTGCAVENCSQTSGIIETPFATSNHNVYAPWWMDNIDNVFHAKIEIIAYQGSYVYRDFDVYATNGIKNRVYWDGQDENGGYLANTYYNFRVTLENECQKKIFTFKVWVDGESYSGFNLTNPFIIPTNTHDNSGFKFPKECCWSDIYIDNVTITGPDQKRFVGTNSVHVATLPGSIVSLTPNADVLFRAGSYVVLGPGFDQNSGTYDVDIVPCPGRYSNPEDEENIIAAFNYNNLENIEDEINEEFNESEKEIALYPNPTKDKLFFTNLKDETYAVNVKDGVGKMILNQILNSNRNGIDCSQLANGIYFVLLFNEHKKVHYKFVKN